MPKFGKRSRDTLTGAHPYLQLIFNRVIEVKDCSVIESIRSEERQNGMYYADPPTTTLLWPNSKHNLKEGRDYSLAVDVWPYPVNWEDLNDFHHLAGIVKGVAYSLGIPITWGGDWRRFKDLPHYELLVEE